MTTTGTARLTSDPVAPEQLRADIARLFDTLAGGGFAVVPLDVAYAVVATTPAGIRSIFETKKRSYDKPSGMFGNWRMSREIHVLDEKSARHGPRDRGAGAHPVFRRGPISRRASAVRRGRSVRDEKLVEGRNPRHAAQRRTVSRRHRRRRDGTRHGRFGSSANFSLCGSKYRLEAVEPVIRDTAAISFDYGQSKYADPRRGSPARSSISAISAWCVSAIVSRS